MARRKGPALDELQAIVDSSPSQEIKPAESDDARKKRDVNLLSQQQKNLQRNASAVSKKQFFVDPASCTIWTGHDRFYELLNEDSCADLIEQFKSEGKQQFPAIVRESKQPGYDYEVITGARRHWVVSWLRNNNEPDFKFLIEPRTLTDEQAFRLSDIENRDKQDISDFERAIKYARALKEFKYYRSQKDMAEKLKISIDRIGSYIKLAELPETIVAAFKDKREIKRDYARLLTPFLNNPKTRKMILDEAKAIQQNKVAKPSPEVLKALLNAAKPKTKAVSIEKFEFNTQDGNRLFAAQKNRAGTINISLSSKTGASRKEIMTGLEKLLEKMNL